MRTKTAYREKPAEEIPVEAIDPENTPDEIPAPPEVEIDGKPADTVMTLSIESDDPDERVAAAMIQAATADDAKNALLKQIEALRRSEEALKQQQAVAHAHRAAQQAFASLSPEAKIAQWRQQGLTEKEAAWLQSHPEAIDNPQISSFAANEALAAGYERDTDPYFDYVSTRFDDLMKNAKVQAAMQPPEAPKFFAPPPARAPSNRSSMYAAPVSRGEVGAYREPSPSQVRLTADELQIAATSGISPTEYARNKLRLEREKRTGERQ